MNWISLSSESPGVVRDENGVPVEWTLLRIGVNPICQEGKDGALVLSADAMRQIIEYHAKKGELIPVDSEHYLFELANQKKLDEAEYYIGAYALVSEQLLFDRMISEWIKKTETALEGLSRSQRPEDDGRREHLSVVHEQLLKIKERKWTDADGG